MLRATVRRALAEFSPATRPFESPGFLDRSIWRMQALFSSRSYEDVLFEKTHRFQVEEVYLFDARSLAMVSFASCDPARHSTAKRVESAAKRIAQQIRTESGDIVRSVERPNGRNVITEKGKHVGTRSHRPGQSERTHSRGSCVFPPPHRRAFRRALRASRLRAHARPPAVS